MQGSQGLRGPDGTGQFPRREGAGDRLHVQQTVPSPGEERGQSGTPLILRVQWRQRGGVHIMARTQGPCHPFPGAGHGSSHNSCELQLPPRHPPRRLCGHPRHNSENSAWPAASAAERRRTGHSHCVPSTSAFREFLRSQNTDGKANANRREISRLWSGKRMGDTAQLKRPD